MGAKNRGSLPLARSSRRMVSSTQFGGRVVEYVVEIRAPAGAAGLYRKRRMSASRTVRFWFARANFLASARAAGLRDGLAAGQVPSFSHPARAPASVAAWSWVRVPATYPVSMAKATIPTRNTARMATMGTTFPGRRDRRRAGWTMASLWARCQTRRGRGRLTLPECRPSPGPSTPGVGVCREKGIRMLRNFGGGYRPAGKSAVGAAGRAGRISVLGGSLVGVSKQRLELGRPARSPMGGETGSAT